MDYSLEERYIMSSEGPVTKSFHWYKPCSKTSFQMNHVLSDDAKISHGKQPFHKTTVMNDCQPGKYIGCAYDKERFLGIILMTSEEDQDVQVKFMMKSIQNHFNWTCRNDVCWVLANHVSCLIETVSAQSAGVHGYCISENEFDNILKLFENFSV